MEKIFNVISYGESIAHWLKAEKPVSPNVFSIGVNHTGMFTELDYLLLIDHPAHFTPEKISAIKKTYPVSYFIADMAWMALLDKTKCAPVTFDDERRILRNLKNDRIFSKLPYSYNSPFVAAVLAYRMGAQIINLWGVDFNTDSAAKTELAPKNIEDWRKLHEKLTSLGVQVYTTPESQLSKFIQINPNL